MRWGGDVQIIMFDYGRVDFSRADKFRTRLVASNLGGLSDSFLSLPRQAVEAGNRTELNDTIAVISTFSAREWYWNECSTLREVPYAACIREITPCNFTVLCNKQLRNFTMPFCAFGTKGMGGKNKPGT